jgi:hypothetical protein
MLSHAAIITELDSINTCSGSPDLSVVVVGLGECRGLATGAVKANVEDACGNFANCLVPGSQSTAAVVHGIS